MNIKKRRKKIKKYLTALKKYQDLDKKKNRKHNKKYAEIMAKFLKVF